MRLGYKISLGLNLLLLAALAAGGWLFLVQGNVTTSTDDRTAVVVTAPERDMVLGDMRAFLVAVQAIVEAAGAGDIPALATAARSVGMAATGNEPVALMGKLPLGLKTLGFGTHAAFDTLAQNAEASGNGAAALVELGDVLAMCTACHASYKFVLEASAP